MEIKQSTMFAKWVDEDQRFAFADSNNGGVEISREQWQELLQQQQCGKMIVRDQDGSPVAADRPAPPPPSRAEVEAARLRAYAHPITGSDRYFAEAQRESLLGNADAAEAAKAAGLARFAEIQTEHPWPEE